MTYVQPRPCSSNPYPDGGWDDNDKDCFPQVWTPYGGTPGFAIFHKYLVGGVKTLDTRGGSPEVYEGYSYEGGAAWHHQADPYVPLSQQSWSDWRGYGTVNVFNGTGTPMTKYRLFRGLNGDRCWTGGANGAACAANGGVKTSWIDDLTPGGPTYEDSNWLAGRVLEQRQLAADWTTVVTRTLTTYESRNTAELGGSENWMRWARWTDVASTTEYTRTPAGGFVSQTETLTYSPRFQPATRHESGWDGTSGDERCTLTTYAFNPTNGSRFSYPASEKVVAGACNSTNVLSETEWYYDNLTTLGWVDTRGNMTRSRSRIDATTWGPWEAMTYDARTWIAG